MGSDGRSCLAQDACSVSSSCPSCPWQPRPSPRLGIDHSGLLGQQGRGEESAGHGQEHRQQSGHPGMDPQQRPQPLPGGAAQRVLLQQWQVVPTRKLPPSTRATPVEGDLVLILALVLMEPRSGQMLWLSQCLGGTTSQPAAKEWSRTSASAGMVLYSPRPL